jgi:hypothetical protein
MNTCATRLHHSNGSYSTGRRCITYFSVNPRGVTSTTPHHHQQFVSRIYQGKYMREPIFDGYMYASCQEDISLHATASLAGELKVATYQVHEYADKKRVMMCLLIRLPASHSTLLFHRDRRPLGPHTFPYWSTATRHYPARLRPWHASVHVFDVSSGSARLPKAKTSHGFYS